MKVPEVFVCESMDFQFKKPIETKYDCCIDKLLEYGIGMKVMLTTNLAPHLGLANGS